VKRREFITLIGGAAATWPLVAQAQQPARTKRIGLMANLPLRPIEAFRKKLQELGYVEESARRAHADHPRTALTTATAAGADQECRRGPKAIVSPEP
jgi:hypothetical protein